MPFEDLRTFLDQPTLDLKIGRKTYTVQPVKAAVWLRIQEAANRAGQADVEPIADHDLFRMVLGADVYDAMLNDLTGPELRRAGMTAYLWQLGQESIAEQFWISGGKAVSPATPTRTRRTTPTGAAASTRRRASGTGTSTRKKSSPSATR